MKIKGVNPVEQHFEKAVLGGVSLVLLGVVATQFLLQPNRVKVGDAGAPVPPDKIYEPIRSQAQALLARIEASDPVMPEIPVQNLAGELDRLHDASASVPALAYFGRAAAIAAGSTEGGEGAADSASVYVMPTVPVPTGVSVASYRVALDPFEVAARPELREALKLTEQPYDVAALSVEGVIDAAALRESLETDPDGDAGPMRPLPLSWWRGNLEVVGVEVEREERTPAGEWTGAAIVAGLPGVASPLSSARAPEATPMDLRKATDDARLRARDVVQPSFPRAIAGEEWVRPSEREVEAASSTEDREIVSRRKQLDRIDRQVAALEAKRQEQQGGGREQSFEERRGNREGGGGGGGGERDAQRQREEEAKRIDAQLARARRDRDRIRKELADLGVQVGDAPAPGQATESAAEPPIPPLTEAAGLPVWTHDFTAEPGKTYRYRVRLVVNNPLFGRGAYLTESQQGVASSAVVEGAWSEWSAPVVLEPREVYFFVSASEGDALGSGPKAAVEVFRFYYGYWRRGSATLEPGDRIDAMVRLPDGLWLWDETKLAAGPGARPGEGLFPPPGERGLDPVPEDEYVPFEERRLRERETREEGGPPPGAPSGAGRLVGNEPPPNAIAGPESLEIEVPVMLLDVHRLPMSRAIGERETFEVVVRDGSGRVDVRRPDSERGGSLYARLVDSARSGESQGRSEPEPTVPGREEKDRPVPGGEDPAPENEGPGGG